MTDVRIISEPLGGSALSQLLQRGGAPARWTTARPASPGDWRARAAAVGPAWKDRWNALLPAIEPTSEAAVRLARVREEGGVVVTTGQQPGLFGGPMYTWSKAMSALALADALEAHLGIPSAPVFWGATDDADFAEAATTTVARVGGLDVLRASEHPLSGTPMALARLGDLRDAERRLREACGSAADARPLQAIAECYGTPERSHGAAFVALLRSLLAPLGVSVLDASHDAVRAASEPTIHAALARAREVESAVADRVQEIRAAGHEPQVDQVPGLALAFVREGSVKRRLTVEEAAHASGWLTPNVLLRPIVEQAILPTVAYVAGPGELAYFAQVSAVADALGLPVPLAVPRWSGTVIEPHVQRLLDEYNVAPAALEVPDELEGRLARAAMSDGTARALAGLRETIALLPDALGADSEELGVGAAVIGATQSIQHRVDRLERRLVAALKRRESEQMHHIATLRAALRPHGLRPERVLNAIPALARSGCALLESMRTEARVHADVLLGAAPHTRHAGASE